MENIFQTSSEMLNRVNDETFKACFGITMEIAAQLALKMELEYNELLHLFWALYYLRRYPTTLEMEAVCGVEHHTLARHTRSMLVRLDRVLPNVCIFFISD